MAWPEDADDEDAPSGPPLPPDDRLWRHPSEVGGGRRLAGTVTFARPHRRGILHRSPSWWYVLAAFTGGSVLTLGGLALVGELDDGPKGRQVVEKVAALTGGDDPNEVAETVMAATVHLTVTTNEGTRDGSGILFRDDGYILTTADLVTGATGISATMGDGQEYEAALTGSDPSTDLAVVSVVNGDEGADEAWPSAVLGSSSDVAVGERVVAVGSPATPTSAALATETVIRATGLRLETAAGPLYDLLLATGGQTDLPAGSALVDQQGAVVGVVTVRDGTVQPDPGLPGAYAIPMQHARRIADQLVEQGHAEHAWMGAATEQDARGARVTAVRPDSPAEAAGLEPGDVITAIAGIPVGSATQVAVALLDHLPDDHVVVMYLRDGDVHEAEVELAERPTS